MSFVTPPPLDENNYPLFAALKRQIGFIPNLLRAQAIRKDLLEAQSGMMGAIFAGGVLERRQKEYIFLAVSARNLSTYCVTAHCEIVRALGLEGPEPEQIALDHNAAEIPFADKALLNFTVKLNNHPDQVEASDVEALRVFGFSDAQILEAILLTGLAQFANTAAFGLGTVPDFDNERVDFQRAGAGQS
jgi:uncharacterized peroxidase-related enzyme